MQVKLIGGIGDGKVVEVPDGKTVHYEFQRRGEPVERNEPGLGRFTELVTGYMAYRPDAAGNWMVEKKGGSGEG